MTRIYNTNEFIEKVTCVHGHKYDYSNVDYITSKIKVKILCSKHGSLTVEGLNDHYHLIFGYLP